MALTQVWTDELKRFITPKRTPDGTPSEEAIAWTWYHMRRQATGVFAATQQFFNVAKGGTDGAVTASELETNMDVASQLGAPKRFLVTAIGVIVASETCAAGLVDAATADEAVNSINQCIDGTVLQFFLQDKKYLEIPVSLAPAGAGLAGFSGASTAGNNMYVSNGAPLRHNTYPVLLPIPFSSTFYAAITNPKGFTTTGDLRLTVYLDGILMRVAQ